MSKIVFALDRNSARSFDADGRMRVKNCIISTAEINDYAGAEIPGYKDLGLDADKIYPLYRDPDELKKIVPSVEGIPLLIKHIPQTADAPQKEFIGGSVHSAKFDGKNLRADLLVFDKLAIDLIESEKLDDLSLGYRYTPDMTPGEVNGKKYAGVMRNPQGNHVALVEEGRATGAHVADSKYQSTDGEAKMAFNEIKDDPTNPTSPDVPNNSTAPSAEPSGQGDMAAIGQALKSIAESLQALHAKVGGGAADEDIAKKGLQALQAKIGGGAVDEDKDDESKTAEDADLPGNGDNPKLPQSKQDGTGARGEPTPIAAMDAVNKAVEKALKVERARVTALEQAKRDVRTVLGDVYGMDSADSVYAEALKVKGVTAVPKGFERAAWLGFMAGSGGAPKRSADLALDAATITENKKDILQYLSKISVKS